MNKNEHTKKHKQLDLKLNDTVKFRGSMLAPLKQHGEEMLGGVILGREWKLNGWEYRIQHPSGNVLYCRAH